MLLSYSRIEELCNKKCVTVTDMCRDADIPRSALSDYKAGRKKTISLKNVSKIAGYFDISIDELMGSTERSIQSEPQFADSVLKAAFFDGEKELTTEQINDLWADVREYAAFKAAQKKGKNG